MKNLKTPTKRYVNKRKITPNKPIKTANALMGNAPIGNPKPMSFQEMMELINRPAVVKPKAA